METAILNVLLFLIIAVAGFGILAIFLMIVVEKTRDIGILKSLGASGRGIMGIFLGYGLSLGLVGSGVGMVLGLLFVRHINEIADRAGPDHRPAGLRPGSTTSTRFPRSSMPGDGRLDRRPARWLIAVLASILPALPRRPAAPGGGPAL